ncbi:Pectin acetylesterase 3 [Diplonema papillatum]|nr:Pectin acetylesterase 3 [Diplonema papillatum]
MATRSASRLWLVSCAVTLAQATYTYHPVPGTLCMDGTTSGYYSSPGSDAASEKVAIGLMGGLLCGFPEAKGEDCKAQSPGPKASSDTYATQISYGGLPTFTAYETLVMSNRPDENPDFHDFHKVWIPQCSSDMHIGRLTVPSPLSYGFTHAGAHNFELILAALRGRLAANVTEVLLTGIGTGGFGAIAHCNRVAGAFAAAQTSCVAIDGFLFPGSLGAAADPNYMWMLPSDYANFAKNTPAASDPLRLFAPLLLWQADILAPCAQQLGTAAGACITAFMQRMYLGPRLFIAQNRYDSLQLQFQGVAENDNSTSAYAYMEYYGQATKNSTVDATFAFRSDKGDGVFLTSCYGHLVGKAAAPGPAQPQLPVMTINGVSAATAIGNWYHNRTSANIHQHTCSGVHCDASCRDVRSLPEGPEPPFVPPSPQLEALARGTYNKGLGPKSSDEWMAPLITGIVFAVVGIAGMLVVCLVSTKFIGCACCCGVSFLVAGLVIWSIIPLFMYTAFREELKYDIDSPDDLYSFMSSMEDKDVPKYRVFYAWNITNIESVMTGTSKPRLEAVGPFVYQLFQERYNVSYTANKERVRFREADIHKFLPEKSVGPEDTLVYTINMAYAALIGGFAQQMGLSGEGEVQMAFPAFLFEAMVSAIPNMGVDAIAPFWGNDPGIDAMLAQAMNVPGGQLPFALGFRTFTKATGNEFGLDPQTSIKMVSLLRMGPDGKGAERLAQVIMGLKAAATCLSKGTPCSHLPALLAVLGSVDPAFANATLVPVLNDYFLQLTEDRKLGPRSLSVLSALSMSVGADGTPWMHRLFTRGPVRDVWFGHDDPLFKLAQGTRFPMPFPGHQTVDEDYLTFPGFNEEGSGLADWRDSWTHYVQANMSDIPFWNVAVNVNQTSIRYTPPSIPYGATPDGEAVKPGINLFVSVLFRPIMMKYIGEADVHGISSNTYVLDLSLVSPDPAFYNDRAGFINMMPTTGGALPLYLSAPHFAYAFNSSYRDKLDGLHPLEDPDNMIFTEHMTGLMFEPMTGLMIKAARRIQMNLLIGAKNGLDMSYSYPKTAETRYDDEGVMFPMFYVSEQGEITDDYISTLKSVKTVMSTRFSVAAVCWIVGPLLVILSLVFAVKHKREERPGAPVGKYIVESEMNDRSDDEDPKSPDQLLPDNGNGRNFAPVTDARGLTSVTNVDIKFVSPRPESAGPASPPGLIVE